MSAVQWAMRFLTVVTALVLLVACATPYHKSSPIGGYKDEQTGPQTYQVTFTANLYTSDQRMNNVLLLRASEVTLREGYEKFTVLQKDIETKTSTAYGGALLGPVSVPYPVGTMQIRVLRADDPGAAGAYDAASTKARVEPLIRK